MKFWKKKLCLNPFWALATSFVILFQATFIFGAFQSELFIKSYDDLKFFRPKIFKTKIYDTSIEKVFRAYK